MTTVPSAARAALAAGLAIAGIGVTIQFLSGVPGFPTVPPGPFILVGAALIVMLVRWRWTPAIGLAVALFVSTGALMTFGGAWDRLTEPGHPGPFSGELIQLIGLVLADVYGVVATVRAARTPAPA